MQEVITKRGEFSKTYALGKNKYRYVTGGGIHHWKYNYADAKEQWKEPDLTFKKGRIEKAPFILDTNGGTVVFTDRKTGDSVELIPDKISDYEIVPFVNGCKVQKTLIDAKSFEQQFGIKVKGKSVRVIPRAVDDDGDELEVEAGIKDGVLTERIKSLEITKPDGSKKHAKFPIKIDPEVTIQPSTGSNYLSGYSSYQNTNYSTTTPANIGANSIFNGYFEVYYTNVGIYNFDISSLSIGSITSALFSIYSNYSITTSNMYCDRIRRGDYVYNEATWNNYKSGSAWATAGAQNTTSDVDTTNRATYGASYNTSEWFEFDVTDAVTAAITDGIQPIFIVHNGWSSSGLRSLLKQAGDSPESNRPKLYIDYVAGVTAPTVTTSACTLTTATGTTGNGNITDTGGENCTRRGFCYIKASSGDPTTADSVVYDDGDFGTGAFSKAITGLDSGSDYRVRAYAVNSAGTGYGTTVDVTTDSAIELSCSDGFKVSDTAKANLTIGLSATDGISGGDSPSHAYIANPTAIDGIKLSETATSNINFSESVTDGVKLSDQAIRNIIIEMSASDIVKIADTALNTIIKELFATDGVKLSYQVTPNFIYEINVSDIVKMAETPLVTIVKELLASDQIKLSDQAIRNIIVEINASDTFKMSDATLNTIIKELSASDSVNMSDESILNRLIQLVISSGVTLSDEDIANISMQFEAHDGLSMGEILATCMNMQLIVSDDVTLSDRASLQGQLLKLMIMTNRYRKVETITTRQRQIQVITTLLRLIKIIMTGG